MTLKECETCDNVEKVFVEMHIPKKDMGKRNALMLEAVGTPTMCYSINNPTDEQKYEMLLFSLLDGEWKYAGAVSKIKI